MRGALRAAAWRLTAFLVLCSLASFALLAVYGQLRFDDEQTYRAEFTNVTGLESGNFVRIAGVEVGKVKKIAINSDNIAVVDFSTDHSVILTMGTRATVRYENLIGDRYLALEEGAGSTDLLAPGQTIPTDRTAPALDLDALIGGFRPLFRALEPDQVNTLSSQLLAAFQGQGDSIGSLLTHTAALTTALADRDVLIGEVIDNLNTVLGSVSEQDEQLSQTVQRLSQLIGGLAGRKDEISTAAAYANTATATVADLLLQARGPIKQTVAQGKRATDIAVADREYLDNLVNTLPDAYRALGRQGLYGDFFSFYLCDAVLKVNGKGGQPVYIKVAGQSTGRCAPK